MIEIEGAFNEARDFYGIFDDLLFDLNNFNDIFNI